MEQLDVKNLLQRKEVLEEIVRHQWIESERAGYDIGFERAAEDWLKRFSTAWMNYHMPQKVISKSEAKSSTSRRRRAKSYIKE